MSIYEQAKRENEIEAVEAAIAGVAPDHRLVWEVDGDFKKLQAAALEMQRGLFALGCEFFQVVHEPTRGQVVADGWYERPEIMARYSPPGMAKKSGMSMELNETDRARLRRIVRKTHRAFFRDDPSTRLLDSLIDGLGPDIARRMVKAALDRGQL